MQVDREDAACAGAYTDEIGTSRQMPQINMPTDSPFARKMERYGLSLPKLIQDAAQLPAFIASPPVSHALGSTSSSLLKGLLWEHRFFLFCSFITATGQRVSGMMVPVLMGFILDKSLSQGFSQQLGLQILLLFLLLVLTGAFIWLDQFVNLMLLSRSRIMHSRTLASHAIEAGTQITRRKSAGELLVAINEDGYNLGFFILFLPAFFASLATMVIAGWQMLSSSVLLGSLVMLGMPLAVFLVSLSAKPLQARSAQAREARAQLGSIANDLVLGLRVLRGLGGEHLFRERYNEASQRARSKGIELVRWRSIQACLRVALPVFFQTIVVALGAYLVFHDEMTAGSLLAFYGMTTYLQSAMNTTVSAAQAWVDARVSAERSAEFLAIEPEFLAEKEVAWAAEQEIAGRGAAPTVGKKDAQATAKEKHAEFASCADVPLCSADGVICLEPGHFTALVSSSPEHAMRYAQELACLDAGALPLIGGLPASSYPLDYLRSQIRYAHGEDGLFAGSLRLNLLGAKASAGRPLTAAEAICWYQLSQQRDPRAGQLPDGQPRQHDDELLEALELAQAYDVVGTLSHASTHPLDGEILELGRNLSGGQRQRLALARALIGTPPVLILCEPTSALDKTTEAAVAEALARLRQGKTTLVVSVSPLILRHADTIVVLSKEGKILGSATHRSLLEAAIQSSAQDRQGPSYAAGHEYKAILQEQMGDAEGSERDETACGT